MSQLQDHNLARKISFSWEKKPGVSKETTTNHGEDLIPRKHDFLPKLPPPPCTVEAAATAKNLVQDFQIPLPPCAFQPPFYRTSSKKGLWVQDDDDPFLAAYKECTKNQRSDTKMNKKLTKGVTDSKSWKGFSFFSCKRSSTVCDNSLVRINIEKV
ncbi:uncharacterized protein LOC130718487 [Lotus japonicus]|uniref:uncharacterized protein LOC130718487 n=1 Tax=Lotus japonicus TaxID=34305 RepID=UPI0025855B0B|nr:uncharacterized protein LOC130718487 [Lotus japonicus]